MGKVTVPIEYHGPGHFSYQFPSFLQVAEGSPCNCPCQHQLRELELQYHMDREGQELEARRDERHQEMLREAKSVMPDLQPGQIPVHGLFAGLRPERHEEHELGPWRPPPDWTGQDWTSLFQKNSHRKGNEKGSGFLSMFSRA